MYVYYQAKKVVQDHFLSPAVVLLKTSHVGQTKCSHAGQLLMHTTRTVHTLEFSIYCQKYAESHILEFPLMSFCGF